MSFRASSRPAAVRRRVAFVDVLRGLAVLFMIAWHTAEGWIQPALRDGDGWRVLRTIGGLGAPLFLTLAGAAVTLRLRRAHRSGGGPASPHRQLLARGILLIFLGYALHLQFWLLDSLAIARPESARVWLPAGAGLALAVVGCGRLGGGDTRAAARLLGLGGLAFFGGIHQLAFVAPGRLGPVLRVDVLQHIGAAIVIVTLACRCTGADARPWRAIALAAVTLTVTPLAAAATSALPGGIASWVVRGGETAASAPASFPLLPWLAYGFVGAALGSTWDTALDRGRVVPAVAALAAVGLALALATAESLPHGYELRHRFGWIVQPMRVTHRVGLILVLTPIALALASDRSPFRWLGTAGRASLVVYWVHLEPAFGIASRPLHHGLGYAGWTAGAILLTIAMVHVARFRLGPLERWRCRALRDGPLSSKRALL